MRKSGASYARANQGRWVLWGVVVLVMGHTLSSCGPGAPLPIHPASSDAGESVVSGVEPTGLPVPITANPKFVRISVEQGLSQSSVYSILQDGEGSMWFGTEDGLNRYDGYSFRIFRHEPDNPDSLSDNWISSIVDWHGLDRHRRRRPQQV